MKSTMDKKVQGMRSQTMSFVNDGMEVMMSACSAPLCLIMCDVVIVQRA